MKLNISPEKIKMGFRNLLFFLFLGVVRAQEFINIPTATDMYRLSYILDLERARVTFEVRAETLGWVGFGFTNISGMIQSDEFIGGVRDGGELYHWDMSSVSVGTPAIDDQQDWRLLDVSEEGPYTTIRFERFLVTGDAKDISIDNGTMSIIWALGASDNLGYHGFSRSTLTFNLFDGTNGGEEPNPPPTPPPPPKQNVETATTKQKVFVDIPIGSAQLEVSYSIVDDEIIVDATSTGKGWIAFGFSNRTGMEQADCFIAGVNDATGEQYFGDYFAISYVTPTADQQQDWRIISASQTDAGTNVVLSRPLNTNDTEKDVLIEDKEMTLIWALGTSDSLSYHGAARGVLKYNLIANAI